MVNKPASRFFLIVGFLFLVVAVAWIGVAARARARHAGARPAGETPLPQPLAAAAAPAKPADTVATPDGLLYTAPAAQHLAVVVRRFWPQTHFMTRGEMEAALRRVNGLEKTNFLKPGQQITIPGYEARPIVEKSLGAAPDFEVRAVYLTGIMAGSVNGLKLVERWRAAGGNSVVFDVKDSDGTVNIPFQHALAPARSPAIPNLAKYVRHLHHMGMHVIARIALFRDDHIAQHHSALAVRSRRSGQPWLENGKLVWADPSRPEVQEYNLALAKAAAAAGVDEVQFDYVRFPAEGDQADAQFWFQQHPTEPCGTATPACAGKEPCGTAAPGCAGARSAPITRADVITGFLQQAYTELHRMNVLVSLDVFGVMAWQRPIDLSHTGQDIVRMVRWCDVLSPMIYPSHFYGMDGYAAPGDAPEHFISTSMERFRKITAGVASGGGQRPEVVVRPWLQAFGWRTRTYSPEYIRVQVEVSKQQGGNGFLFWNARNDYSKPLAAMPEMRAHPGRFFRGDELPGFAPVKTAALMPQQ